MKQSNTDLSIALLWDETVGIPIIHENEGDAHCKTCDKLLSLYNPGPYCFVHKYAGNMNDFKEEEVHLLKLQKEQTARRPKVRKLCRIKGCVLKHDSKGLCNKHRLQRARGTLWKNLQ